LGDQAIAGIVLALLLPLIIAIFLCIIIVLVRTLRRKNRFINLSNVSLSVSPSHQYSQNPGLSPSVLLFSTSV